MTGLLNGEAIALGRGRQYVNEIKMDQRAENEDGKKNIWVSYSAGASFKGARCSLPKKPEDHYWEGGGSDAFL